jgi:anaerobic ribonucleoside-triphosphate reductase activating protein
MAEDYIELTIDGVTGDLIVAHAGDLDTLDLAGLGPGRSLGCGRPHRALPPPVGLGTAEAAGPWLRIADYYHNSLIEGPGRRSVVRCQGCKLACVGCHSPETHALQGGALTPVEALAAALLDPAYERDGISILGGEPTLQPEGLLALIAALRRRGCADIGLYSGYTLAALRRRAAGRPALAEVLTAVDWLIDGPFDAAQAAGAGAWRGSRNQRFIPLARPPAP